MHPRPGHVLVTEPVLKRCVLNDDPTYYIWHSQKDKMIVTDNGSIRARGSLKVQPEGIRWWGETGIELFWA